jgi:PIN domain nuclease of toxin-antitoxin system
MTAFVSDTHAIVWYLSGNKRLSSRARTIFEKGNAGYNQIVVPSIVLVETILLVQRARIDQAIVNRLLAIENPIDSIYIYPLHKGVIRALNQFGPAAIPELADRIIAATALYLDMPLLTVDESILASKLVKTVW